MSDWVVSATFDLDPDMATMDAWEAAIEQRGYDVSIGRAPQLHQAVVRVFVPTDDMMKAAMLGHDLAVEVVGEPAVGVEAITEDELERRAAEPTMPELMSAAEIADELGVRRQRVHQLRATAAFPAPLAELRGGAVWDARAVRKFAQDWTRKPGRPPTREPRTYTYRSSDGRMIDLSFLKSKGITLTKKQIDGMSEKQLDKLIHDAERVR